MSKPDPKIIQFVQDVRDALSDLRPSTVDQLTEGLDAELAERSADEGATFSLGSPAAFASELRESAGVASNHLPRTGIARWRHTLLKKSLQFLKSLTPVWWLLRALIAWDAIHLLVRGYFHAVPHPESTLQWWIIAIFAFVSVQFGRGVWRLPSLRWLLASANILVAILVLPFALAANVELNDTRNRLAMLESGGLIAKGHIHFEVRALDANGAILPMKTLTDSDGYEIFTQPDVTPEEFVPIIGLTKEQATAKLLELGYPRIQSKFVLAVGVAKGNVIDAQHSSDASGHGTVELTISAGPTK